MSKKKKQFCVPVWTEETIHYYVDADSIEEAEEIIQECMDEGDASHIANKCKSCDCGILSDCIEEI
jgi:hypothetical protein